MMEDTSYILGCYAITAITLFLLLQFSQQKKQTALIHLGIQLTYSVLFLYSFLTCGPGGGILAVIVLWLVVLTIHWVALLVHLLVLVILRKRERPRQ